MKVRILGAGLAVCLLIVAVLGVSTWSLQHRLDRLEVSAAQITPPALDPLAALPSDPAQIGLGGKNPALNSFSDWEKSFAEMEKRIDKMMGDMMSSSPWDSKSFISSNSRSPEITFEDKGDEYKAVITVPEGEEVDINTGINNGVLTISGRVSSSSSKESHGTTMHAQSLSEFSQSLMLDEPVDPAAMKVVNNKHKIVVTVPKRVS